MSRRRDISQSVCKLKNILLASDAQMLSQRSRFLIGSHSKLILEIKFPSPTVIRGDLLVFCAILIKLSGKKMEFA